MRNAKYRLVAKKHGFPELFFLFKQVMSIFKSFFNISLSIFLGEYPYIPHFEENFERFEGELLLYHYSKNFHYRLYCIRVIPCILQNLLFYLFQSKFSQIAFLLFELFPEWFYPSCYNFGRCRISQSTKHLGSDDPTYWKMYKFWWLWPVIG